MNAYFFKMSQAERNDILDQHKKIYDGFVTSYGQQINQQPLYVQDYANDKEGMVVNNKGVVKTYTNLNINEANAMTLSKFVPEENLSNPVGGYDPFESEYEGGFDGKDKIADNKTDMKHGTFDDKDEVLSFEFDSTDDTDFDSIDVLGFGDEIEEEIIEPLQEQVNKTLDMFKRFKNF